MSKDFLKVVVEFSPDGRKKPLVIYLQDGTKYLIDKVLSVKPRPSFKSGGIGERYEIMVCGKPLYLFYENSQWYLDC